MENECIYQGKVVGVTFSPTKENFKACLARFVEIGQDKVEPVMRLEADPNNPFDPNAVKVLMKNNGDDQEFHIGWIPGPKNGGFNKILLDEGLENLECRLLKVNLFDDKIVGFGIEVVKKPSIF